MDFDVIFSDTIIGIYKITELWKYFEKIAKKNKTFHFSPKYLFL